MKSYSTQISFDQDYPFDRKSFRLNNFYYEVRIKLPFRNENNYKKYQKKFQKIADLEPLCSSLIKLNGVIEQRSQNYFNLIYEHIPYALSDVHDLKIQIKKVQKKIKNLYQFLLHKRIQPRYDSKCLGFNENHELKYLMLPNFSQIFDQEKLKFEFQHLGLNVKNILSKINSNQQISPRQTVQDDKTSQRISERDLSAYNKIFQEKISLIESKLQLNKYGNDKMSSSQKMKRRKKLSQNLTEQNKSMSSSSSNSLKINQNSLKLNENSLKINGNSLNINDNTFKSLNYQQKIRHSYRNQHEQKYSKTQNTKFYRSRNQKSKQSSSQQQNQQLSPQQTKKMKSSKLTNSLIIEEQKNQQMQKLKHHKSSFGDYSNYQAEKQQKLKRRISFALQKSQYALKIYQRYQSKRNGSINNQGFANSKKKYENI